MSHVTGDVTNNLLSQVCSNVQVEPQLQPVSGETLSHCTSNADEQARLDISAKGFWHLLMLDCSILWPKVILINLCLVAAAKMKMRAYE